MLVAYAPQHDAQFDYYGRRLATASSDRTIRVFDVGSEAQTLLAELKGYRAFALSLLRRRLSLTMAGMRDRFGKCRGRTQSLEIF